MMDKEIKTIILNDKLQKYEKLSDILKYIFVDIAGIDQKKYFILGSYAIREHRLINDLDINLDFKEFIKLEKAIEKKIGSIEFYNNQIRWFYDLTNEYNELTGSDEKDFSVEAFQKMPEDGFPNSNFSLKYLADNNGLDTDSNGHQFFSLDTLLKWKMAMNRPKDQDDIKLLESLINKTSKMSRHTKKNSKNKTKKSSRRSSKKAPKRQSKRPSKSPSKRSSKKAPKKTKKRT